MLINIPFDCFVEPPLCELYDNNDNTTDAVCFGYGSIGYDYVFLNNSDSAKILNERLKNFDASLQRSREDHIPPECIDMIFGLMCHHSFPLCDHNSNTPVPRQVCSYCIQLQFMHV